MMTWLQAQCSMDFSMVSRSFMFTCIRRCRGLPINHESNVVSDIDQSLACTSWMPSFMLLNPLLMLECPRDFLLCSAAERLPSSSIVCASKIHGNIRSLRVQRKRQLWVGLFHKASHSRVQGRRVCGVFEANISTRYFRDEKDDRQLQRVEEGGHSGK